MARLMRALLALVAVACVTGKDTGECALNGARAIDDMLDSAVYIMASLVRCDSANHDAIRCALDVSSAIESVNKMVNVIVKAVDDCDGIHTSHAGCGMAVGVLTRSMAGLSAASAGIVAKCPNALNNHQALATVGTQMEAASRYGGHRAFNTAGFSPTFGQCVINVKDSVKSLFKAIKRIMTIKENCRDPHSEHCMHNAAKIVAALSGLAEYVSGAVAKCTAGAHSANALCAQMSIRLFHALSNVDRAGTAMADKCHISEAERLYLENEDSAPTTPASGGSTTLALAALLPLTAVVSFIGGKRLAKSRAQITPDAELVNIE